MKQQLYFLKKLNPIFASGILLTFLALIFLTIGTDNITSQNEGYLFKKVGNKMSSQNINNNFSIDISNGSFSLIDFKSKEIQSKYHLQKIDINDESININSKPSYSAEENKLTETHNEQLKLNYTNTAKGFRQDFVIENGPTKDVKFNVELLLETEMAPYQIDKYSIGLKHKVNEAQKLQYRDLLVYDAKGKFLECEMTFDQIDEELYKVNLYAYADHVDYPLTIDPLSTSDSGFESMVDST